MELGHNTTAPDVLSPRAMNLFSDEVRRNPFPVYEKLRSVSPLLRVPPPFDAWVVLDYDGVKRVLNDHESFSSCVPAPRHWFLFLDPPVHTKLRALISKAFTPRMVANLEPRIRELSRELLDGIVGQGEIDLAAQYSTPLPMKVIAEMIGVPAAEWQKFRGWSDVILKLSYTRSGGDEAAAALTEFRAVTVEMTGFLGEMIEQRRLSPRDDLLSHLVEAEVDGEHLRLEEILGFFQLLVVGGQETTANLINNSVLCLIENPLERARLEADRGLLPRAIEEVLRYRSPVQWMMRTPRRDVVMHGQTLEAGKLVLPMIGSANHDPKQFSEPEKFNILREPNPHIAFGHGIHSCIGAALARMEARIALTDLLERMKNFQLAGSEPWQPRQALHVHGPARLPIRFTACERK